MDSWMKKFEEKQDLKREKQLNERLELLEDYFEKTDSMTNKEKYTILQEILETYKNLKFECFRYNEEEYLRKSKELELIKNKILEEKYRDDKENISWEEYKNEEMEEER